MSSLCGLGGCHGGLDEPDGGRFDVLCGLGLDPCASGAGLDDAFGKASLDGTNHQLGVFHEARELETKIDVNPNFDAFDQGSPWNGNCSSCSLAVYARMTGIDPTAMAGPENIAPFSGDMERITGMRQVEMTPAEIRGYALSQGAGYTGICGFDRSGLDGHWICVHTGEHEVYALDGQTCTVRPFLDYVADDPGIRYDLSIRR